MEKLQPEQMKEKVNLLLQRGDSIGLYEEIQTKEFKEAADDALTTISILCLIDQTERNYGYKETVLKNVLSLSEAKEFYMEFRFYCYRVESSMPSVYIMEFISFIKHHKISGIALFYMLEGFTWRREHNILVLAQYLKRSRLITEATVLLHLAANEYKGNDQFLLELAECYMELGQWKRAYKILSELPESSKEVRDIMSKLEEMINEENGRKEL